MCSTAEDAYTWREAVYRLVWVEDARYPKFDFIIHNAQVMEIADLTSSDRLRLM